MTEAVSYEQNTMAGGEVMEVMMTGGDGTEMNEDTLAQVVNMLQMEGQLTGGNQTIIIRQPGSNEIQMIQATSNGDEVVVSKASEADIQALQAGNGVLAHVGQDILDGQQGQVVMMDEGGNLVEGMVQMQDGNGPEEAEVVGMGNVGGLGQDAQHIHYQGKSNEEQAAGILGSFNNINSLEAHNLIGSVLKNAEPVAIPPKPITISTTTNKAKPHFPITVANGVVSIKVNTGIKPKTVPAAPKNAIKISTITGQQKYQPPKFHKCEACSINFVSKVAYMNHMENCPSKKKSLTPLSNKTNITYTCVFCETKFTSRLILMQHVRTCNKAKSTKNLVGPGSSGTKLKVPTSETRLGISDNKYTAGRSSKNILQSGKMRGIQQNKLKSEEKSRPGSMKKKGMLLDSETDLRRNKFYDSESDEDKDTIPYDDDEDFNEEFDGDDDNLEEVLVNKRSQKHLGPIVLHGMFKCRDCSRTFSKEHQYNRHVKGCTNAPLNTSRIVGDSNGPHPSTLVAVSASEVAALDSGHKRKRGRMSDDSEESPLKKRAVGPRIVSVNPKSVVSKALQDKARKGYSQFSDNESDEEIMDYLSGSSKLKKNADSYSSVHSSINKIVKISPSNKLVKKTGKAILSKMNQERVSKVLRDVPLCGLCGDKFKTNSDLIKHTKIVHSEDLLIERDLLDGKGNLTNIKCPLCDFYYLSSSNLLCHVITAHDKELRSIQDELEMQNLYLQCPFCSTVSLSQDLLKEHIATKHLDKLIAKPTSNISALSSDISSYLNDGSNDTLLQSSKLFTKQEKILCPDCGLFFMKSYFEHHKCASVNHSPSARKFVCSESQCTDTSFYKLIHLLTHLQQVHEKTLPHESHSFETVNQFLEWLKKEENDSKMKYTKAMQRMKQGKLNAIWICHRFHNAVKDTTVNGHTEEIKKIDRQHQCYSRIHAETYFSSATSRYDGKTVIRYYPAHHHPADVISTDSVKPPEKPKEPVVTAPVTEKQPTVQPIFNAEEAAFSNAAELQQLLEDDEPPKTEENGGSTLGENQLTPFENVETIRKALEPMEESTSEVAKETDEVSNHVPDDKSDEQSVEQEHHPVTAFEHTDSELEHHEKENETVKKEDSGLVSLSDTDLLLEKMLGEHVGGTEENEPTAAIKENLESLPNEEESQSAVPMASELESLTPTEAKITDVDMLEAFGVSSAVALSDCLTPEENSSTSTASNALRSSECSETQTSQEAAVQDTTSSEDVKIEHREEVKAADQMEEEEEEEEEEEDKDSGGEEDSTYVLPADIEEWNKLFELVGSQVSSNSISSGELEEAKTLLSYENQILSIPIEKQVEIFNRICSLANVQMT